MGTTSRTERASESDADLWRLVLQDSETAFEVLVRRHQSVVRAVAYSARGNPARSEDVAQETFWTAWRRRSSLERPDHLRAWVCGVARNLAKNARRKASRSVAGALNLSEDAVKQRLSRGRTMPPSHVVELVEDGLRRGRPGRRFTLSVMAGPTARAAGAKTALAGAGGLSGGLPGTLGGLLGGWLGTWVPAQLTGARRERDAILRAGRRMWWVSLVLVVALVGLIRAFAGAPMYLFASGGWMAAGGASIARDHAVGGQAHARHANDDARAFLFNHPFTRLAFTAMGQRRGLNELEGARALPGPGVGVGDPTPPAEDQTPRGRFALNNGLTVRIRPIQGANQVALLVLYKIGGDHDPQGRSGLAHLVEHLYVTAAAGDAPARAAEAFFRQYPAGCNAQTGDRYTVVAAVFPPEDLAKELRDAAARMGDLRIEAADLDRERPRLLDEVENMFGRIPALGAVNVARERIRPTPRGGRKGGLPEHLAATTLDDVQTHWKRYYKPKNAILVLAGSVDVAEAQRAVVNQFAEIAPGEEIPPPAEPGPPRLGLASEVTVRPFGPRAEPVACVAYASPRPGSDLHAPFLVLAARFWAASARPGAIGETDRPSVYFPLLEDPDVLGVSGKAKPDETPPRAIARLESFVADTIAPPLRDDERTLARRTFAIFLGTAEIPDFALAQNPYGAALSLARREQLGIDPTALGRAFDALTEQDLRRAADTIFAPERRAEAWIAPAE